MATIIDKLTPTQRAELDATLGHHGGVADFAERHGLNPHSLRGALSREAQAGQARDTLRTIRGLGPVPKAIKVVEEPKPIYLDKVLYAADFHVPFHSELWLERLAAVALALEVEDFICGGDLADFDCLSSHPADLPQIDLNQAIETVGQVIRYLRRVFKWIWLIPGNHDRRLSRLLNKNLNYANVVKMFAADLDGITAVETDYLYVNDNPGWTVGHPRFFASFPAKGLDTVALNRGRNVLGAHSHTLGMVRVNDQFWAVSPGAMHRPELTPYIQRSNGLSRHADQSNGFVLIEQTEHDGDIVTVFADGATRWSDYL